MSNIEIIDKFLETFRANPEMTVEALKRKMVNDKYEFVVKTVDPLEHFGREHPDPYMFPIHTGERSMATV